MSGKVLAIVQARMDSGRLPGKVLKPIAGRAMVLRVADRLRGARRLDEVALATTTEPSDEPLVAVAEAAGLRVHRGPVDDIAARLSGAMRRFEAEWLVRAWGDCPLIDPAAVDALVELGLTEDLDYACNGMRGRRTYPPGLDLELYRRSTLERLLAETSESGYREFPVEFILANEEHFHYALLNWSEDLSALHLSVDYPEDLECVERIVAELEARGLGWDLECLVDLLREKPELAEGFAHSPRNIEYKAFLAGRAPGTMA